MKRVSALSFPSIPRSEAVAGSEKDVPARLVDAVGIRPAEVGGIEGVFHDGENSDRTEIIAEAGLNVVIGRDGDFSSPWTILRRLV